MVNLLTADALKEFIKEKKEKDYLIVDVRQPEEYRLDHIPGSVNIPLAEIQFDPYLFDEGRDIVFCCTRGVRSKVAALFVADSGHKEQKLYHLQEGLVDYSGEILLNVPRIDLIPKDINPEAVMKKAIDFEKGAWRFYILASEKTAGSELSPVFKKMINDEMSHGKAIFRELTKISRLNSEFNTYFDQCEGDILEGGQSFEKIRSFLDSDDASSCMDMLEFAIEIEYQAYDLYKTMAENTGEQAVESMFFMLAQAEKKHLDQLIRSLDLCPG